MLRAVFILLATTLAFAIGYLVAGDPEIVSREVVIAIGSLAALLIALQMIAQLAVLARAERTEEDALLSVCELDARREQLRLVSRLSESLSRECAPRGVATTAADFLINDMGASTVVFWTIAGDGLPSSMIARSAEREARAREQREERESSVLVRNAVAAGEAVYIDGRTGETAELSSLTPDERPFSLFVPLQGSEDCQGVIEIETAAGVWRTRHWDFVPALASQVGIAFERARIYEEMQKRADLDFVTGVYNHRFMHAYLERVIAAAHARDRGGAIVFLDVDNFKAFNDSLGHSAGDRVLQTVANQLRLMTDRVGLVGRSGGDEFMVVLPYHNAHQTRTLITALQDWLSVSAPPVQGMFRIQVSCGYAVYPDDGENAQELLAAADARLYHAKTHARQPVEPHSGSGNGPGERTLGVYGLLDQILDHIHQKDNYTRVHCEKTAEFAAAFAQVLGLSPSAHRSLRLAALLHDVGKVGVPDQILCKPGPLSPGEREVVQHQLKIAAQLIVDVPNADEVRAVVRHHRERWDGTGYPDGLAGDEIPHLSRVLAVADAYAAITLDRPYRLALPPGEAYAELKRVAGTQLDPDLVDAFASVVRSERRLSSAAAVVPPAAV